MGLDRGHGWTPHPASELHQQSSKRRSSSTSTTLTCRAATTSHDLPLALYFWILPFYYEYADEPPVYIRASLIEPVNMQTENTEFSSPNSCLRAGKLLA
jgi:hypothetical protein